MEILNVTHAAEARRSIRKYTSQPVPEETIREVLRVAGLAPSPWNVQPWRVIVVRDPETKDKLMAAAYGQPQVGRSQFTLVLTSDMEDAVANIAEFLHPGMTGDYRQQQISSISGIFEGMGQEGRAQWGFAESNIFLGFLLLALQSHGLSSSAMLGFDPAKVKELFGLPDHVTIPAIIAVGYADEEGFTHHRHELDRFVRWE